METINISFKGFINVDTIDIALFDQQGESIEYATIKKLSAKQIVDGLQDGTYMLNFTETYANALNGEESYEYSIENEG